MSSNKFTDDIADSLGSETNTRDSFIGEIVGEPVSESTNQAEAEKALVKRLPKSVFKGGIKPEEFYGGSGTAGILQGLYLNPAQAAEAGMAGAGPKALFNEFGEPVDESGKPFHLTKEEWSAERSRVTGKVKGPELTTTPEYVRKPPEYRTRPVGEEDSLEEKIFGSSLSDKAKAQALVKLMANEEGVPLSKYKQGPRLLEMAGRGFVQNFIPANFALYAKEALEGMEPDMPENAGESIAYHLGSLAGFVQTTKMFAAPMVSPVANFLQVGAKAPVYHRIISESLRDAALIGTASGLLALPESLESTTFTGAAGSVLKSIGSGALIGTIFGTSRGMFPTDAVAQRSARIATGLVGLNAMRAAEVGGNPFTDRPVGEVVFDTLLDTFFLWKGMPEEKFADFDAKIAGLFARRLEIRNKEVEITNSTVDEAVKQAQLKMLEVEKQQLDLKLQEELKSANFESMIKHDLAGKGGRVLQIKGPKKYSYDEVIDKAMRGIKEEVPKEIKTKEDLTEEIVKPEKKAKVVNIENAREGTIRDAIINDFNNTPDELRDTPEFKKQTKLLEQIKVLEGKLTDKPGKVDDKILSLWSEFNKLGDKLKVEGKGKFKLPIVRGNVIGSKEDSGISNKTSGLVSDSIKKLGLNPFDYSKTDESKLRGAVRKEVVKEFGKDAGKEFDENYREVKGQDIMRQSIGDFSALAYEGILKTRGIDKPYSNARDRLKVVDTETTELDLATGTKLPDELSTNKSPFRQKKKFTEKMTKLYDERVKSIESDIEMKTSKLLNDVNRYLDGEEVPIDEVRNQLSNLATDAGKYRGNFDKAEYFNHWRNTISNAAEWARNADRSKIKRTKLTDTQLNTMVPLGGIPEGVRNFLNKVRSKVSEIRIRDLYRNTDLWRETGYWLGQDGKWRYEIDDYINIYNPKLTNRMDYNILRSGDPVTLPEFYKNDKLYEAVPELKNTRIKREEALNSAGSYDPVNNVIYMKYSSDRVTALHEIQHAVNKIVGSKFEGSSVKKEESNKIIDTLVAMKKVAKTPEVQTAIDNAMLDHAKDRNKTIHSLTSDIEKKAFIADKGEYNNIRNILSSHFKTTAIENYMKDPGEMESRLSEARMDMTDEQRKAIPPWETLDTMLMREGTWRDLEEYTASGDRISRSTLSPGTKLYSGIPVNEVVNMIKKYIGTAGVKPFRNIMRASRLFGKDTADILSDLRDLGVEIPKDLIIKIEKIESKEPKLITDITTSDSKALKSILELTNKQIEADVTYNVGGFWDRANKEGIPTPSLKSDIVGNKSLGVEQMDITNLKYSDNSVGGVFVDLPFEIAPSTGSAQYREVTKRFSGFETVEELKRVYRDGITEVARVLKPGELMVIKSQKAVLPSYRGGVGRRIDIPSLIYRYATEAGLEFVEDIRSIRPPTFGVSKPGGQYTAVKSYSVMSAYIKPLSPMKQKGSYVYLERGTKLYSGLPLDKAAQMVVDASERFAKSVEEARGVKEFRPLQAYRLARNEFVRNVIDKSGNIRRDMLDKLSDDGYKIIQKMYLQKGASSMSAQALKQMNKEVYDGLSSKEKIVLDKLILSQRLLDIAKYKTKKEFVFPKGQSPEEAAAYSEFFMVREGLSSEQAEVIRNKAAAYFEWMKKPLKDMLEAGLISKVEYDELSSHNYRRIKLVDVFDKRYEAKVGKHKMTVYDSGIQRLAHGRPTDVFEPSSEIMALEVFNRAYGRILKNQANMELLNLARKDPNNPFARTKEGKGKIPSGWDRIFVFEEGQRKAIYLSPDMAKEWITSNPEVSYGLSKVLRYASGSPVLRTFATGINWGFALANMPRDIMHAWFAARTFENGKWKPVYSSVFPVFAMQMARDQSAVFIDALLRKGRYLDYIKEGGGMEFLVHQGRLFQRGKHLGGPMDSFLDILGYLGETSEIMTRLAIRERVIRKGKSSQEATFAARDYMDFGQGGGIAKAADNAFPYLNAAIQGTRGLTRAFKDNPMLSTFKLAQFGAAVVGSYIASYIFNPDTAKALKGDIAMRNNLCIPLGDRFGFIDSKGQQRYMFLKVPLDPGQKFFKTLFEGATDKWLGNEVDVDAITGALKETSPVGISELPPSVSGVLGYIANKDFWLNEDIWKKTDKPFSWPQSKEEYIPGKTPQAFIDLGEFTGLSPERTKHALQELFTNGTMWSYLMGKGYDYLFGDLPKDMSEMHMAEVLAKVPVIKRFFGITNPYSQHAKMLGDVKELSELDRWKQNRGLDMRAEGYLYQDNVTRAEIEDYMRSFKDPKVYDRLKDRLEFQSAIKDLPNRSFWLSLKGISDTEARARAYVNRIEKSNPEEEEQLRREYAIVMKAGGIVTDEFIKEVIKIRSSK